MRAQAQLETTERELQEVIRRFEDQTGMRMRLATLVDGGDEFMAARLITVEEEEVIRGREAGLVCAVLSGMIVEMVGSDQTLESVAARTLYTILSASTGVRRG